MVVSSISFWMDPLSYYRGSTVELLPKITNFLPKFSYKMPATISIAPVIGNYAQSGSQS